jgi:hypothetical protein
MLSATRTASARPVLQSRLDQLCSRAVKRMHVPRMGSGGPAGTLRAIDGLTILDDAVCHPYRVLARLCPPPESDCCSGFGRAARNSPVRARFCMQHYATRFAGACNAGNDNMLSATRTAFLRASARPQSRTAALVRGVSVWSNVPGGGERDESSDSRPRLDSARPVLQSRLDQLCSRAVKDYP